MSGELGVVMPYWLDRADEEAIEIALAAEHVGIDTAWIGELVSFDAFALATAVGLRTERLRLKIGPLAAGVRSPSPSPSASHRSPRSPTTPSTWPSGPRAR